MIKISDEVIDRYHIVRECREKCAEAGFSGKYFEECVKSCIEKYSGKDST